MCAGAIVTTETVFTQPAMVNAHLRPLAGAVAIGTAIRGLSVLSWASRRSGAVMAVDTIFIGQITMIDPRDFPVAVVVTLFTVCRGGNVTSWFGRSMHAAALRMTLFAIARCSLENAARVASFTSNSGVPSFKQKSGLIMIEPGRRSFP